MKTDPSRRAVHALIVILLTASATQMASGCATKTGSAGKSVTRPGPYVSSAEEIMQHAAVKARTRELIDSGKYKDSADARRAANKEYPPAGNSDQSAQETAYYYWRQQMKVQEKFEADLEKMKRKS